MQKLTHKDEYPYSRAKIMLRGTWYLSGFKGNVLLEAVPVKANDMLLVGYRCTECRTLFIAGDYDGLYHACNGVYD